MNIVDINDIEDIIRAKINIDKNNEELKGERSNLNEFMMKYCNLQDIIMFDNDKLIPFYYLEDVDNQKYLFISDKNNVNIITEILNMINYNMDNLKEINIYDINTLKNNKNIIIHNNKYYAIV